MQNRWVFQSANLSAHLMRIKYYLISSDRKIRPQQRIYVTTSPSMDILISSNLERMIYRIAGNDAKQCAKFMAALTKDGEYVITDAMKAELSEFFGAFGSEEETAVKIKKSYDKEGYVMDTHTAVAAVAYDK